MNTLPPNANAEPRAHPRTVGWFGTTSVAMGGINQSLFLLSALFIGQGSISGQGSAAVVLLGVGLLLSWAATPGWTELILMYPNRVGGIAATCAEAFKPYSPVLANLTGVCYWWGWVPTCGLTALLASSAIQQWYLPQVPVPLMASGIVLFFTLINLCGVKWVMRFAMPIATASALLAFFSAVVPIYSGEVDWQRAFTFQLTVPFPGWFGQVTSVMAGLYLIGFAAPAFEQAACHVGETINPNKNVPRAMFVSAGLATLYFIVLPIIWLGALGPEAMGKELALVIGPTFAPLLGGAAKAAAIWFMIFNMLHGTIAALAGASRTLAQLSEDGLLPEFLAKRSRTDAPWASTLLTAGMAIAFLLIGDPVWLIAAANLTYLIGIALPSVAVWLLRHNQPQMARPYRAPRGTILLGLLAACAWGLTAILGFQQFGLPTVLVGIAFAYSGSALYAWRKFADRRKLGLPGVARSLHLKLTGAMLLVLVLDAAGYLIAVSHVPTENSALIVMLEDIFVVVALLTISVGLVLPGMIAHAAVEVSAAADKLVEGTLADFTRAMQALAAGDLDAAKAHFDLAPIVVHSRDEVGDMAQNFNRLQDEIGRAALGLEGAREGLSQARSDLTETNERLREQAALLDKATDAILLADLDDRILYLNRSAMNFYGWTRAELAERPGGAPIYQDRRQFEAAKEIVLARGEWRGELAQVTRDGRSLTVESSWTLLRDAAGCPKSVLSINTDIAARKLAEAALAEMNSRLRDVSRQAGMAEVATSVLHNVGNVLNSVNITSSCLAESLRRSKASSLSKVVAMLHEHEGDLAAFFTGDGKGQQLPAYLGKLAAHLMVEQEAALRELAELQKNVEHIKQIVGMQQSFARVSGTRETLAAAELMEEALKIESNLLDRRDLVIHREFDAVPPVSAEKHKVLQILVNLLANAEQACSQPGPEVMHLTLRLTQRDERVLISVSDNGGGIEAGNLTRIFAHGFTTKPTGHGFGLHSGALAAKEMGGSLSVHSDGPGLGATFTLELPCSPPESPAAP
ncbi:amino acid permease [bacterium]|nr:amino acid permease [bacterium]